MPGLTNRRRAIQEGSDWTKGYSEGGSVKKYVKGGSVSEKEMEIWKRAAPTMKERVRGVISTDLLDQLYRTNDPKLKKKILTKIGKTDPLKRTDREAELYEKFGRKAARKRSAKK